MLVDVSSRGGGKPTPRSQAIPSGPEKSAENSKCSGIIHTSSVVDKVTEHEAVKVRMWLYKTAMYLLSGVVVGRCACKGCDANDAEARERPDD